MKPGTHSHTSLPLFTVQVALFSQAREQTGGDVTVVSGDDVSGDDVRGDDVRGDDVVKLSSSVSSLATSRRSNGEILLNASFVPYN